MTVLHQRLHAATLVGMLFAAGCTSVKTIHPVAHPAATPYAELKAGDTVQIRKGDGRRTMIVVRQITSDAIVSSTGVYYRHDEIVRLERRTFNFWRTFALGVVVYLYLPFLM